MSIHLLYNAQGELQSLMHQTLDLVRACDRVCSMKGYLHCHDILEMTEEINRPWDHPGFVYGDLAAFVELELTLKELIHRQDPNGQRVKHYVLNVTRFLLQWKQMMTNRSRSKKPF